MRIVYSKIWMTMWIAVAVCLGMSVPCLAASNTKYAGPTIVKVSTLSEFLGWYTFESSREKFCLLQSDLIVDREVSLEDTAVFDNINTNSYTFRVVNGGRLTLDDRSLAMFGMNAVITVEPGGELVLRSGGIYNSPISHAVVVKYGGHMTRSSDFVVEGKIYREPAPELPTESEPSTEPEPPTVPALPPDQDFGRLLSITYPEEPVFGKTGEPLDPSDYPDTVYVTYDKKDGTIHIVELPVIWELNKVDVNTAGSYKIKGVFSEEVLAGNSLKNPEGVMAEITLNLQKSEPVHILSGKVLSVETAGKVRIQLKLSPLSSDLTAIYLYRSSNGIQWEKAFMEGAGTSGGLVKEYNFLDNYVTIEGNSFLHYSYRSDYRPIWLRVEIAGSLSEGMSESIKIEVPAAGQSGGSSDAGGPHDDENGSSGGNRGGGGQGSAERVVEETAEAAGSYAPVNAGSAGGTDRYPGDEVAYETPLEAQEFSQYNEGANPEYDGYQTPTDLSAPSLAALKDTETLPSDCIESAKEDSSLQEEEVTAVEALPFEGKTRRQSTDRGMAALFGTVLLLGGLSCYFKNNERKRKS